MESLLINRKALCSAFDFAKNAIPQRPIILADGNILLTWDGHEKLMLSACDGCMGAKSSIIPISSNSVETFTVGVDPKRFGKAISKDTTENICLSKKGQDLVISNPQDSAENYVTLLGANMRRASILTHWVPEESDLINNVRIKSDFIAETLSFLDSFTSSGSSGDKRHDILTLENKMAHTTNGCGLRGIVVSKEFNFSEGVCFSKRFIKPLSSILKQIECDSITMKSSKRIISFYTEDQSRIVVLPTEQKIPPEINIMYLQMGEGLEEVNVKEWSTSLDRMTTSNYNTITALTGLDIDISKGKIKFTLEGSKASCELPFSKNINYALSKVVDIMSFYRFIKVFAKSKNALIQFGDDSSRFVRVVDKREFGEIKSAFIAAIAYARKV